MALFPSGGSVSLCPGALSQPSPSSCVLEVVFCSSCPGLEQGGAWGGPGDGDAPAARVCGGQQLPEGLGNSQGLSQVWDGPEPVRVSGYTAPHSPCWRGSGGHRCSAAPVEDLFHRGFIGMQGPARWNSGIPASPLSPPPCRGTFTLYGEIQRTRNASMSPGSCRRFFSIETWNCRGWKSPLRSQSQTIPSALPRPHRTTSPGVTSTQL